MNGDESTNGDNGNNRHERREKIKEILESLGHVPRSMVLQIAGEYHCSVRAIYRDIDAVYADIPMPIIEKEAKKLLSKYLRTCERAELLSIKNPERGLPICLTAYRDYTEFLERFGYKNPVVSRHIVATANLEQIEQVLAKVFNDA